MTDMGTNVIDIEHNGAIRQLESGVRRGIENFMRAMIIVCFVLELGLGVYFYFAHIMTESPLGYLLLRVILPCSINIALYLLMFFSNRSHTLSEEVKNRVCSTSFILFCGELSIIHSYFVSLWMLSFIPLMFAGIFHDHFFHKIQAGLSLFFIIAAGFTYMSDYPDKANMAVQYMIVSSAIGIAICYFAFELEEFSRSEFLINFEISEGARKYKANYEFDALTGVFSRGHLEEEAHETFSLEHNMTHVGVAMIDIDNFKSINDTYGHDNGDLVLKKLVEYLSRFNTMESFCGRYGGEEFVIVFKIADSKENLYELENLRVLFEQTQFEFAQKPITISIGYHIGMSDDEWDTVLKKADEALYESKNNGKNRITVKE